MRNFYLADIPQPGDHGSLSEDESRHAVKVLRIKESDRFRLLDGEGTAAEAVVCAVAGSRSQPRVNFRVLSKERRSRSFPAIHLYTAPPRARQMDYLIQAATSLGVKHIQPVRCERGVAEPASAESVERWRKQAVSAVKQSGNPFLPAVSPLQDFGDCLRQGVPGFFGEQLSGEGEWMSRQDIPDTCSLWVGPEGGFTETEKEKLRHAGVRPMNVGSWIMRVETAVPVLMANLIGAKIEK